MMLLPDVLRFLAIFSAGIATGTWVVTQLALIPALRELPPESASRLFLVTEGRIVRFNPLCALAATVAGLLLLTLRLNPTGRVAFLTTVGCAGALGATLVSVFWNMPLRRKIAASPNGGVPAGYARLQQRWNRGNLARTVLGLASFGSYVLAAL